MKYNTTEVTCISDIYKACLCHLDTPKITSGIVPLPQEKIVRQFLLAGSYLRKKGFSDLTGAVYGEEVLHLGSYEYTCLQVDFLREEVVCGSYSFTYTASYDHVIMGRKDQSKPFVRVWFNGVLDPKHRG